MVLRFFGSMVLWLGCGAGSTAAYTATVEGLLRDAERRLAKQAAEF